MKARVAVWVCDNPTCASRHMADVDVPDGWMLRGVTLNTRDGGAAAKSIFACQDACVLPALLAAVQRDFGVQG